MLSNNSGFARHAYRLSLISLLVLAWGCGETISNEGGAGGSGGDGDGGAGGQAGGQTGAPCTVDSLPAGDHDIMLSHEGIDRPYRIHIPPGYDGATIVPTVVNFHGLGSNSLEQAAFSAMDAHADLEGYIAVYPNGFENSWNGGSLCCGDAADMEIDDVSFARALVADVSRQTCVDADRIYATGMSNGGFMSHRLGCEASDVFAAIAPVAGLMGIPADTCQPQRPVPIVHFYGTADNLVPYDFADDVNDVWVDRNGCTGEPTISYQQGTVTCETHESCEAGATVTLCSAEGMGHCWPGMSFCPFGSSTEDISANTTMWDLFKAHTLP